MRSLLNDSISVLLACFKRLRARPGVTLLLVSALMLMSLSGCGASDDDSGDDDGNGKGATNGNGASSGTGGSSGSGNGGKGGSMSSTGGLSNEGPRAFTEDPGSWTYLVYMLADNDLEPFGVSDLQEMMTAGSSANLQILVQVDRAEGESSDGVGGLDDFTTTKRVRVNNGSLEELGDLGETNMGDPATLTDFIKWGLETSQTDHVALVLWDHGGAWPQYGVDFSAGNDGLSLPELTTALGDANLPKSFDIIGFDACLMATWEVAATLAPYARFLIASEEVEPGHGWDHSVLSTLGNKPKGSDFALALVNGYVAQAETEGTAEKITISVTDLDQIKPLSDALSALSTKLGDDVATHAPLVAKARANSPTFGEQPGGTSTGMTDITLLMNEIAAGDTAVGTEVAAVKTALEGAVFSNQVSQVYSGAGGLALYFPLFASDYDAKYDMLDSAESWRGFLQALYGSAQNLGSPPVFTNPNHEAFISPGGDGILVEGQLQEGTFDNLATATLSYAVVDQDDGTVYYVGSVPADVDETGLVSSTWDLSVMTVGQADAQDYGYYSLEVSDEGYYSVSIPLGYTEPGSDPILVVLSLVLDQDGNVLTNTYYTETAGAWGELYPLEGSTFTTLLPVLYPGETETTWEEQTVTFDATQPLDLDFVALEAGIMIGVELVAVDYANQGDAVSAITTL